MIDSTNANLPVFQEDKKSEEIDSVRPAKI